MSLTISVNNLTKEYNFLKKPGQVLGTLIGRQKESFTALSNISFEVEKGETFGIVGPNGAGKSTILKILAGVLPLYSGDVQVNGQISAILEVATSFSAEVSGRQNIRRHLRLKGLSESEIRRLEPEIIDFSELEDVIDQRVASYSTGMAAKLAFATATASISDIVLIDELLAVGDEHFQAKCLKKVRELCSSGRTVILASHNLNHIERFCQRALWLEHGRTRLVGNAHDVCLSYYSSNAAKVDSLYPKEYGYIESVSVKANDGALTIESVIMRLKPDPGLCYQIAVHDNTNGLLSLLLNTGWDNVILPAGIGKIRITAETRLPCGLQYLLVGTVLSRTGTSNNNIQDACGWDNGRQVELRLPHTVNGKGYAHSALEWNKCS